jgi:hypothetical protein
VTPAQHLASTQLTEAYLCELAAMWLILCLGLGWLAYLVGKYIKEIWK